MPIRSNRDNVAVELLCDCTALTFRYITKRNATAYCLCPQQVDDWSTELMEAEFQAKNVARALLFVLDSETRAVAASVEAALLAATPKLLLLVMRPYSRQQTIGQETITDQ